MLYTRYGDEIFIDSSGNIGLGRNNSEPEYPLDVSGSIYTSGIFITDISSSAPLQVHSSIRVNNLNVEYFDNQSSSYYRDVSNINSGTLNVTHGGIGTSILGVNKVLLGDGTNPVISSNDLTWNSNQLDVSGNLNFTGDLYKNGQLYVNSQWVDGSNNKIYYNLGNVGIGADNPNYTLDVSGNLNFSGNLYQNGVLFEGGGGGGAGQWEDGSSNKIYYTLGNVGIGTSNPTRTLDVSGDLIVNNFTVRDEWFIAQDTISIRNQLQLQPILKLYYLSGSQSVFDISLNGYYDILPNNVGMYLNGTKLLYYDNNNKEYDVSVNHIDISHTEIIISVYTPTQSGDILDVTIYPTFPNDVGTRYPGYVYQVFNQVFNNVSGIGTAYTFSNLGIGTTIPTQHLDVSGNALIRGTLYTNNIDFSGNLYQNGSLYISSQWTDGSNNKLYYDVGFVGIGTNNPQERLDVSGNVQLSGHLLPKTNIVSDLGSSTNRFRDLYLSGSTIDISGALIKYDPLTGGIKLSNYADNTLVGTFKDIITDGNVTVGGNLTVNGSFTTLDTHTVVVEDPILTLGGYQTLTVNDNKNRGIEFRYYNGSSKIGFFGFDNTSSNLVYLLDASNNSETFTGLYGNMEGHSFMSKAPQGIPPFVVDSSTVVSNLNVQYLDGQNAAYYNDWNNLTNKPNLVNTFNNRVGDVSLNATDISNALSYVPLNATTYTASDILDKLITVDGSGSQLDADYLDGQDSTFFRDASNINAGVLSVTYGGIGVNNLSTNKLLVGNGTSGILSPDSLTWNGSELDVSGNIYVRGDISTNGTITGTNINFTGYLYQNGSPYIGSQWGNSNEISGQAEDGSNNKIYYNSGYVGIGTSNPTQTLDISGYMIVNNFTVREEWFIAQDTSFNRTRLQVHPILNTYKITSNNVTIFDISLNGRFTINTPKDVCVFVDGIKLGYIDSNNNDYSVVTSTFSTYTQFTVTLNIAVNVDNIVDITIYPKFVSEDAIKEPGYVYQVFNNLWDVSNNKVFYNNGYVGIGTNNPQERLDVSGNILLSGNLLPKTNITSDLGSSTNRFRDLYLSGSTIDISGALIKYDPITGGIKIANYADNTLVATFKDVITDGNVTVGGNLTVNGTFVTLDTQTVTVEDPIITLGGSLALNSNDSKDRGIEFRYYDTTSKVGFFGYDNNTGNLVYLLDASSNGEIFTGTYGNIRANQFIGSSISVTSTALVNNLNADLLDGQHGAYYNNWNNLTNKPNLVNTFNNRVGDVSLNATDISTALAYVPLDSNIYTASDVLSKLIMVDGSGSQLDADFLDGYDSTYYRNVNNINAGTLNVSYGGIGVNNLNSGKLLVGNGTNPILSPSNLTWDGSNLGIGTQVPSQVLDISGNINFSGFLYQNGSPYIGSQWYTSGNVIYYNTGNVGIGSSNPSQTLDVSGNISCTDIYFTGGLYQNGSPYIGSQWDTTGNQIYYNTGNVGIGSSNPSQILDVSGNINFTGNLYQNGSLFEGGGAGQWIDASNNKIYYNLGNVGIGTNDPTQTLDISGDMIVNNFTVRNEWFIAQDTPIVRNQLQLQPINQTFIINTNGRTVFDISMNGQYTISNGQYVYVYVDGVKLGYYDVSTNDYTYSINNQTQYTLFTITLNRAVNIGNIVEIYIYPKFVTDDASKIPGYVYQAINSPWDVSNNHAFYTVGNVGIGTTYPLANLDISGSFMLRGNFIDASENVKLYSIVSHRSYTPVITASIYNPVYTSPTFSFRYVKNGYKIDAEFVLECNLSYEGNGTYYISLPYPLSNSTTSALIGSGLYTVNGYNYNVYYMVDSGTSEMYAKMIDGLISSNHPFTNNVGTIVRFSGSIKYETGVTPVALPESKFPLVMDGSGNVYLNNKLRYLSSQTLNWVSHTPTITATSSPNFGTGATISGKYIHLNKTVIYQGVIVPTSNGFSGGSGTYYFSMPFIGTVLGGQDTVIGTATVKDTITGMTFAMNCVMYATDPLYFYMVGTGVDDGKVSNAYPLDPISSSVTISWDVTYEAGIVPYDIYQDPAQFLYLDNSSNLVFTKDIYDTNGNLKLLSTNIPRQSYTPLFYASITNPTTTVASGGLYNMRYMRLHNTVIGDFTFQFQIEQPGSGNYKFTLPLTPDTTTIETPLIGTGMMTITTPTIYRFTVSFMLDASGHVVILIPDTTMYFTHNHPLQIQSGYTIRIQGMISYETLQTNILLPTGTNYALSMDVCGNILFNNEKKYLSSSHFNWSSYTPAISATVNPTLGTGANLVGRYTQIGKTVTYQGYVSFGSGFSPGSGNYYITLPVPVYQFVNQDTSIGTGYIIDSDTGTTYSMTCNVLGNDNQRFYITGGSVTQGILGANFPRTPLTNSIKFSWYITYEATIIPYDVPIASALSNAVVTDGNGNLGIGTNVLDKKLIINGDVKFGRGLYNGSSDGTSGGTFYKSESWDNPGATHTITYPTYCIGENSAGTLMIQVSNKDNSTPKVGNAMVSFIKSNTENTDVFIISTHSNDDLITFNITNSGNNIIVTTDGDCRVAWTSIGGY